jgi:hypothetical protein
MRNPGDVAGGKPIAVPSLRFSDPLVAFYFIHKKSESSSYPYPTKWGRYNMFFIMLW